MVVDKYDDHCWREALHIAEFLLFLLLRGSKQISSRHFNWCHENQKQHVIVKMSLTTLVLAVHLLVTVCLIIAGLVALDKLDSVGKKLNLR